MKARLGTPEQQKAIDEWRAKIGQALVDNLNHNVLTGQRDSIKLTAAARPGFWYVYVATLTAVLAALCALVAIRSL